MYMVECTYPYWDFVRFLRTDPDVQAGFIEQVEEISVNQQQDYMINNSHNFYICLDETKEPMGYVGFIGEDENEITYCTDPVYQGNGVGTFMVGYMLDKFKSRDPWAKVKHTNKPSKKIFEKYEMNSKDDDDFTIYWGYQG